MVFLFFGKFLPYTVNKTRFVDFIKSRNIKTSNTYSFFLCKCYDISHAYFQIEYLQIVERERCIRN
jgi:hypothetical protein